jgi:Fe-S cluster biogenesis protein NfuA
MFIETEPTQNPDRMKFLPDRRLLASGIAGFVDATASARSPLARRLFEVSGVEAVYLDPRSVTVTKSANVDWPLVKTMVMGTIMEHFLSGDPVIHDAEQPLPAPGLDSPDGKAIQDLIVRNINPQIASHGGSIALIDVHADTVFIRMQGGCQGCAMADVTLKQGVATQIKTMVPNITSVEDVTDHASGTNPYQGSEKGAQSPFQPSK